MNYFLTRSAKGGNSGSSGSQIRVWDLPVRLFHWLMVLSFAGAYLTAEMENWRTVHVTLGYTMAALVCFRIFWGFFGTHYARFSNFVRGPKATLNYVRSMIHGHPQHFTGHNPVGAVAIMLMLAITIALVGSGWLLYAKQTGEWMEEVHEVIANLLLTVVLIHIAGVLTASYMHRENLVKAMVTGRKRTAPDATAQGLRTGTALLLLLAVLTFWWWEGEHSDESVARVTFVAGQHSQQDSDDH